MKIIILVLLLTLSINVYAVESGNDLLDDCNHAMAVINGNPTSDTEPYNAGYCMGHVSALYYFAYYFGGRIPNVCIPEKVNIGQAIRVTYKYLKDHPSRLHEATHILIVDAFESAWPCKKE